MMAFAGRLILVFTMLIAQMGLGAAVCVCPPTDQKPAVVGLPVCEMSKKAGCGCCVAKNNAKSRPALTTLRTCEMQIADGHALPPATFFAPLQVPAILSVPIELPRPVASVVEHATPQHLVVPRIRPPDPGSHGLRAPPAR